MNTTIKKRHAINLPKDVAHKFINLCNEYSLKTGGYLCRLAFMRIIRDSTGTPEHLLECLPMSELHKMVKEINKKAQMSRGITAKENE